MATKRIGRSRRESTRVRGGSYQLPKAKNPTRFVGYGHQGSGFWGDAYHNEHYIRTGQFGKEKNAKKYAKTQNKQMVSAGTGVTALGLGLATSPIGLTPGLVVGGVSSGYGLYQDAKANKQLDKDTGTKRSLFGGYHEIFQNTKNMSGAHKF